MKIILSHDVDHLYLYEHWRDSFIPGLIKRTVLDLSRDQLSPRTAIRRFAPRLNNIRELATYNAERGLPQTFFFGMEKGLNLSYSPEAATTFIRELVGMGAEIGLHGMAYQDRYRMQTEKDKLESILCSTPKLIRNHYLRLEPETHSIMASLGYDVDSSIEALEQPQNIDSLWVIPISLMDASLMRRARSRYSEMRSVTRAAFREAEKKALPFFVINFHDIYFSDGYPILKKWYVEFIAECIDKGYEFCWFSDAVRELDLKSKNAL